MKPIPKNNEQATEIDLPSIIKFFFLFSDKRRILAWTSEANEWKAMNSLFAGARSKPDKPVLLTELKGFEI